MCYKILLQIIYCIMKYILKTTYPCVVKTQSQSIELEENDNLEIEDEKFLYVYPQNSYQPPFCINLSNKKDTHLFSFVRVKNMQAIVLEKANMVFVKQKEKLNFNGKFCYIEVGKNEIIFETENKILSSKNENMFTEYKIFKCGNFACVQFLNDFYAFSMEKEKIFHFSGKNLSFDNNTLTIKDENENDQKQTQIHFENDLTVETQNIEKFKEEKAELVPLKFLKFVKHKDYEIAIKFLNENLKKSINAEKLQEFFGNISSILPLTVTEFLLISNTNKKYVAFDTENDKINDISIDEL